EARIRRIVAPLIVLDQMPQHVDAKSIDAAIEPEPQHVVHRRPYFGIPPVEIGLLFQERVVVVLPGWLVELPGAATELTEPVVWRSAIRGGITPQIPVSFWIRAARARLAKPRMLIRGVIRNEVEHQPEIALLQRAYQLVEIGERAEERVNAGV